MGAAPHPPVQQNDAMTNQMNALAQGGDILRNIKEGLVGKPEDIAESGGYTFHDPITGESSITIPKWVSGLADTAMAVTGVPEFKGAYEGAYGGLRGFFSRAGRWIEGLPQEKFTAEQLLGQMKNAPIKKEEVEWLGLREWLQGKAKSGEKVTKAQIGEFIEGHQIKMEETVLSGKVDRRGSTETRAFADAHYRRGEWDTEENVREYNRRLAEDQKVDTSPHYNDPEYKTPGGRNYREVLFKYPTPKLTSLPPEYTTKKIGNYWSVHKGNDPQNIGHVVAASEEEAVQNALYQLNAYHNPKSYSSDHFGEQGHDLLAHARVQDFKDVTGSKVMLVDEIQSDWHRAGRKYGYNKTDGGDSMGRDIIPDAPFKGSAWSELTMKGMLRDAVEKKYDKLAWTTGATQQERWSLTRHFPELRWSSVPPNRASMGPDMMPLPHQQVTKVGEADKIWIQTSPSERWREVPKAQLEDWVGQASADDIRKKVAEGAETSGLLRDVKSGGEWATNLYDKQVVEFMNKYTAKWGGKVERTSLSKGGKLRKFQIHQYNDGKFFVHPESESARSWPKELAGTWDSKEEAQKAIDEYMKDAPEVWSITITPAMRDSIRREGQPLWATIPFAAGSIDRATRSGVKTTNNNRK